MEKKDEVKLDINNKNYSVKLDEKHEEAFPAKEIFNIEYLKLFDRVFFLIFFQVVLVKCGSYEVDDRTLTRRILQQMNHIFEKAKHGTSNLFLMTNKK